MPCDWTPGRYRNQFGRPEFAGLPRKITTLTCPHCEQPHLLARVSAWLGELQPEYAAACPVSNISTPIPRFDSYEVGLTIAAIASIGGAFTVAATVPPIAAKSDGVRPLL